MGNGIFSGLEDLGLELSSDDIFKNEAEEVTLKKAETVQIKVMREDEYLFDKTYECPICNQTFKERTIRTGKARLVKTDSDLRPTFDGIEPLKYDVVHCPECGYTALTRYFGPMTRVQKTMIVEKICSKYRKKTEDIITISYEEAINRYKLALANAMVRKAKTSEKAYICLRAGWLVRSYIEVLLKDEFRDDVRIREMRELEEEFIKNSYEGFINAREGEGFPMCGMDETTLDYLIASLAIRFEQFQVASKLIASIIFSPSSSARIKDKARDLKEKMVEKQKESK